MVVPEHTVLAASRGYPIKRVAVVGATGMLGMPVTRALVHAGFDVVALVRDSKRASASLPPEARPVAADVERDDTLASALAGMDAVYVSLSMRPDQTRHDFQVEPEGMKAIVKACRTAHVPHIAYLSSVMQKNSPMKWWALEGKREAVRVLRESGLDHTIFYPANFMESLPFRMRQGKRIAIAGRPRETSRWIAAKDYADQVVAALRRAESGVSREYVIQGPEALKADEAAEIFVKNYTAEPLSVARAPLALFKLLGLFSPTMDYVRHISDALNTTPEPFAADTSWRELGKPATSVAQFARTLAAERSPA